MVHRSSKSTTGNNDHDLVMVVSLAAATAMGAITMWAYQYYTKNAKYRIPSELRKSSPPHYKELKLAIRMALEGKQKKVERSFCAFVVLRFFFPDPLPFFVFCFFLHSNQLERILKHIVMQLEQWQKKIMI